MTTTDNLNSPKARWAAEELHNIDTLREWVEQASGGFLTAESVPGILGGKATTIKRVDGLPMNGPDAAPPPGVDFGRPVTGVLFGLSPSGPKLDRRRRSVMTDVRDDVRTVLTRYVADAPADSFYALYQFERCNHLRSWD